MASRSNAQKTGARGHKWFMAYVEEHPDWLSRELGEDYGIDAELELTEHKVRGDLLKVQIRSSERVEMQDGAVKFSIERKHLEYADACRYPLILVRVDLESKRAWYLWLQDWLLTKRISGSPLASAQHSWTEWVPDTQTLEAGLNGELKTIACWENKAQLALSLRDAMRAAAAIQDRKMMLLLAETLASCADGLDQASLNIVIDEAIKLGDRMRGTDKGNEIADQLFAMVRKCGERVDVATVDHLVLRGDTYSRIGLASLALLYDDYFKRMSSLGLPDRYVDAEPRVAFYCAFREANPEHRSSDIFVDPTSFNYAGLKYEQPDMHWDKYANRGPSALLDYLVPAEG